MRTVYLGTSDFATTVLERLAGSPHRPVLVVTRPDRPAGRGRRMSPPPVAQTARRIGLALDQPDSVNAPEAVARIAASSPEAVVVCAFGALIREPLLSGHEILNVHPSLLPRWRGAAPIERALMAGDAETGVSIMRLTEGLDSGPVCLAERTAIGPEDDYGSLSARLATLGGELLVRALDERPGFAAQRQDGVTYAEKITAADRLLDPSRPASELDRIVRALHPHIGARLALEAEEPLGVLRVRRATDLGTDSPGPGLDLSGGVPRLRCVDGSALELLTVRPAGRRAMSGADWLRGRMP